MSISTEASNKTYFTTSISHDFMKASVMLYKVENAEGRPTVEEICDELKSRGVRTGINLKAIKELVLSPVYDIDICVAEGMPAINGKNGTLQFNFDVAKNRINSVLDDGNANYRDLDLIKNVYQGDIVCTILPAVQGTDGVNIKGDAIKSIQGKNPILPKGKNVKLGEDGKTLISMIEGQIDYVEGGPINVFSTYEVKDDVDNSVGNISFVGNVIVRGNVLSGFSIEAGGNVEVFGVVEAARIVAKGNIILRKGIYGHGKGSIESEGDVFANFIENSIISAKRDIKAEAIMHSTIKCGGSLEVAGRKGLLVGGTTRVGKEIRARVIGSSLSTATEIETGLDPAIRERFRFVRDEIASIESDLKKAEQAIVLLKKLEQLGTLADDKKELLLKSTRTKIFLSSRHRELINERAEIDEKLQENLPGKIKVSDYIYPGTRVAIGSCLMYIKETLQNCTLYRDGADVRVGPGERW